VVSGHSEGGESSTDHSLFIPIFLPRFHLSSLSLLQLNSKSFSLSMIPFFFYFFIYLLAFPYLIRHTPLFLPHFLYSCIAFASFIEPHSLHPISVPSLFALQSRRPSNSFMAASAIGHIISK
jgi:hypothetical protein